MAEISSIFKRLDVGSVRRLVRGVGANVLGQFITLFIQILSIPVLIHSWGASALGGWLLVTASLTYISMGDFGFGLAAANDMTFAVARGEPGAARRTHQSVMLLTLICVGVVALAGAICLSFSSPNFFRQHVSSDFDARLVLAFMFPSALIAMSWSSIGSALKADGQYATYVMTADTLRLFESAAVMTVAACGGTPIQAAAANLCVRLLGSCAGILIVRRNVSWAEFSFRLAAWAELKRLVRPALSVMLLPMSFALNLQGMTMVVGATLGPVAVTSFVAARTLTRTAAQAVGIINHAIMPEVSRGVGASDPNKLKALFKLNSFITLILCLALFLFFAVFGEYILHRWLAGKAVVSYWVLLGLSGAAALQSLWNSTGNMLLAANRAHSYAPAFLVSTILGLFAGYVLAARLGMDGIIVSVLASELLTLSVVSISFGSFIRSAVARKA